MTSIRCLAFVTIVLFASVARADPATATDPDCGKAWTTLDMLKCSVLRIEAADKKLDDYLAAARQRIAAMNAGPDGAPASHPFHTDVPTIDLTIAQKAWQHYRDLQCGDVYIYWVDGTYRYEASSQCQLALTRQRTHDIWSAYLTYLDSTPPVLPEP